MFGFGVARQEQADLDEKLRLGRMGIQAARQSSAALEAIRAEMERPKPDFTIAAQLFEKAARILRGETP